MERHHKNLRRPRPAPTDGVAEIADRTQSAANIRIRPIRSPPVNQEKKRELLHCS